MPYDDSRARRSGGVHPSGRTIWSFQTGWWTPRVCERQWPADSMASTRPDPRDSWSVRSHSPAEAASAAFAPGRLHLVCTYGSLTRGLRVPANRLLRWVGTVERSRQAFELTQERYPTSRARPARYWAELAATGLPYRSACDLLNGWICFPSLPKRRALPAAIPQAAARSEVILKRYSALAGKRGPR